MAVIFLQMRLLLILRLIWWNMPCFKYKQLKYFIHSVTIKLVLKVIKMMVGKITTTRIIISSLINPHTRRERGKDYVKLIIYLSVKQRFTIFWRLVMCNGYVWFSKPFCDNIYRNLKNSYTLTVKLTSLLISLLSFIFNKNVSFNNENEINTWFGSLFLFKNLFEFRSWDHFQEVQPRQKHKNYPQHKQYNDTTYNVISYY